MDNIIRPYPTFTFLIKNKTNEFSPRILDFGLCYLTLDLANTEWNTFLQYVFFCCQRRLGGIFPSKQANWNRHILGILLKRYDFAYFHPKAHSAAMHPKIERFGQVSSKYHDHKIQKNSLKCSYVHQILRFENLEIIKKYLSVSRSDQPLIKNHFLGEITKFWWLSYILCDNWWLWRCILVEEEGGLFAKICIICWPPAQKGRW